jgi:hypothetical protein
MLSFDHWYLAMKQNFKVLLLLADDKIMYVKKDCCNFFLLQLNQILRLNLNKGWVGFMVFNATVNNISAISKILLVIAI